MSIAESIHARARAVIPGGVSSAQRSIPGIEGLVVARAAGAHFEDADGVRYLDFHTSFGPQILGHADVDVDRALFECARRVDIIGVGVTEPEVELAERIVRHVPSVEQVVLTNSGSEATFYALRLARAVTGRSKVLKFQGCYHGWHDAVALNVISPADRVGSHDPLGAGLLRSTLDATIVCRFNDADDVAGALEANEGQVAAVIVEPIPHNVGALLPASGFLEALRELCDRHGALLVFDEVITGFRHHLGGYQAVCGVRPDLTTLGKAIANGYPLGALGGPAELMERIGWTDARRVFAAGTYNGHPAIAAAALATLDKLEQQPVHEHVFRLGERARSGLQEVYAELGEPAVVSGFGSVFLAYLMEGEARSYDDLLRNDVELFVGTRHELIRRRVFELPLNLKRSHVSYAHTDADVDRLVAETGDAVRRARERRAMARAQPAR